MSGQNPSLKLSIIIVVLEGPGSLLRTLRAIQPQYLPGTMEILVPVDDAHRDVLDLKTEFPEVRFLTRSGVHTYAENRSLGAREASGELVAFTEDHCLPCPDWCQQIIAAHANDYAAVGGSVEKLSPDRLLNWAVYFADYLRYMNPLPAGTVRALTDLNVSYKRAALDTIAPIWSQEFHENQVNEALLGKGNTLWFQPSMRVDQQRSFNLGQALEDRYAFGRLFATTRVEHAPLSRRLVYTGFSLLVPFLQVARTTTQIFQKRRWIGKYLQAFPILFLLALVWASGEFLGYLTGRPSA